ncbi:MAG: immune inhibitor A [Ignavibacteriaceae bacterium]|nr:immune inhibitor A [Ignavibacteriaceae bacterium]
MKILNYFLLSLLFVTLTFSQNNYKQVKIKLVDTEKELAMLNSFDIALDHFHLDKENAVTVFLSDEEFSRLSFLNLNYEVIIDDWFSHYNARPTMTEAEKEVSINLSKSMYGVEGLGYGSMGGFYTLAEINAQLDTMRARFPNLITAKQSIGLSLENRPIYAVKISDNPEITENEPRALYTALIHAREPASMATVINYMYYLLENYATNPSVKHLVDNREIWFIPCINPDGYEYNRSTNPSGGGMFRKNRRNNGGSYGIDLNRNFGPMMYWDGPYGGSSTTPSSETYRGTAPFSEPETQVIRDFLVGKSFKTAFSYHTYSDILIFPYGYQPAKTPDSVAIDEFANDMSAMNGYATGTATQLLYAVRGVTDDYYYDGNVEDNGNIFAMTPEVGSSADGFWPTQNRIFPLAQINLMPNLYYTWVAGEYVSFLRAQFSQNYFLPGDNFTANVTLKNKGLANGNNISMQITSLSEFATVQNGTLSGISIPARTEYVVPQGVNISLSNMAPIESIVKLNVKVFTGEAMMSSDTLSFIIGLPNYLFIDSSVTPATKWTITATPANPKWDSTSATAYSGQISFTDSRVGSYVSNATVTMTSTEQISLVGFANPKLTFWTKYAFESKYDCGVVQISTNNGSTWVTLAGKLTIPASGLGKQVPAGSPVYGDSRANWAYEEINLASYAGQNIKLRFELRTDGSINADGWYIDDIGIVVYTAVPVELTSFTANVSENGVNLDWATASEVNNSGFDVQRSSNSELWETLSFVAGKGSTADASVYKYIDNSPLPGKSYYRLVQIDYDGTTQKYGPVEIDFTTVYDYELSQNYPNPFNPSTNLTFTLAQAGKTDLRIYDITGTEVSNLVNDYLEAGKYTITFDASKLSSGIYFYELRSGNFVKRMKMTLLK